MAQIASEMRLIDISFRSSIDHKNTKPAAQIKPKPALPTRKAKPHGLCILRHALGKAVFVRCSLRLRSVKSKSTRLKPLRQKRLHYLANTQGRFAFYSTCFVVLLLTAVPIFILIE